MSNLKVHDTWFLYGFGNRRVDTCRCDAQRNILTDQASPKECNLLGEGRAQRTLAD